MGRWIMILAVAAALASCTPPVNVAGDPLKATSTGDAFPGVSCNAVRPQTEPDLMAWDPGSRANLNRLRHRGVVAVRYAAKGCNVELELLSNCIGTGAKYEFSPYSANERKVAHNATELFAELPLGAARLSGKVSGDRALRTDYMLAGQYALPPEASFRRSELRGPDCGRATHVLSAVYVGAFAMAAGERRAMDGRASVFGIAGGGDSRAEIEVLGDEGDSEACRASQKEHKESDGCGVPLRVALLALDAAPAPPSAAPGGSECPAGMARVEGPGGAPLCFDKTEVTARDYMACVRSGGCTPAGMQENAPGRAELVGRHAVCNFNRPGREDHPINCLRWDQAQSFCTAMSKRLPTREEWIQVATGGPKRFAHPWGNEAPTDAHVCWRRSETCATGSHGAGVTPSGLLDLVGNVWEMTSTRSGMNIVVCGGGIYEQSAESVLATRCGDGDAAVQFHDLGFRCVK